MMFEVGDRVITKLRNSQWRKWNGITGVITKRITENLFAIKTDTPVPHSPHRDKYYFRLPSEDFRLYNKEPKWRM